MDRKIFIAILVGLVAIVNATPLFKPRAGESCGYEVI